MSIEYAIQNIIDICALLVKENDLGVPSSEEDVLARLVKGKILGNGIISTIREMRGFRNFLSPRLGYIHPRRVSSVHRYGAIDDRMAYRDIKKGLADFPKVFASLEKVISG